MFFLFKTMDIVNLIIISMLLALVINHLFNFYVRIHEKEIYHVYFSILILSICCYFILMTDLSRFILQTRKITLLISPITSILLMNIIIFFSIKLFTSYLGYPSNKMIYFIISFICMFFSITLTLISYITGYDWYIKNIYLFVVVFVSIGFANFFVIIGIWIFYKKLFKNKSVLFVICGFFLFGISMLIDRIIYRFIELDIQFMSFGLGLTFFIFSYALTDKFNIEHNELIELKTSLEQKVDERTAELEEEKNNKTNFFVNVAHELKTNMTLIKNYTEKYINEHKNTGDLYLVSNTINIMDSDIKNFLEVESFEKKKQIYNHNQIINFSEMLKRKLVLFEENASRNNILHNTALCCH